MRSSCGWRQGCSLQAPIAVKKLKQTWEEWRGRQQRRPALSMTRIDHVKSYNAHCPYNILGSRVDLQLHDRLTCGTDTDRRWKHRYYLRLVFNFLDQSLGNSRIAHQAIHPDKTETSKEFRLAVFRGIVEDFSCRERSFPLKQVKKDGSSAPTLPGSHLSVYLNHEA